MAFAADWATQTPAEIWPVRSGWLATTGVAVALGALGAWLVLRNRMRHAGLPDAGFAAELEDLYQHAPCGYHSLDADGVFVRINDTELDWLGLRREEVIGRMRFADLLEEAGLKLYARWFPVFKATGSVRDLEFSLRRKDGSRFPVLLSATAVTDQRGNFRMSRSTVYDLTERKRAEQAQADAAEALRQSEERFRRAFEDAGTGLALVAIEGGFLRCNRALCAMLGYSEEELRRFTYQEITHPDDLRRGSEDARRVVAGEIPRMQIEKRYRHRDGHYVWTRLTTSVVRSGAGAPLHYISQIEDLTATKETRERLELVDFALNHVREAAFLVDERARFHYVNDEACRSLGYSREELLAMRVPDIDPNYPMERWDENWRDLQERVTAVFETQHRARDGRVFPVEISANHFEYGGRSLNLALARDITERKRTEEELRCTRQTALEFSEQLARLQEVTNRLSMAPTCDDLCRLAVDLGRSRLGFDRIGIWFIDEERNLMLGSFGTDERGGIRDERHAQVEFRREGLAWQVYSRKEPVATVAQQTLHDHAQRDVGTGANAMAALWDGSRVIGVVSVDNLFSHAPITERQLELLRLYATTLAHLVTRKRAEEATRLLNDVLERRVAERTAQLEAVNQSLRAANRELEAFSYSVSHDLRAPLRGIDGFSRILLEDYAERLDEEGRDCLRRVRAASQRMGTLIDNVLELSRTARAEMSLATIDLSELARDIVDGLRRSDPARSVECTIEPGLTVFADPGLMRILLDNLLGNAWKFTSPRPHAIIELGATILEDGRVFFVRDNGAGFDMAFAQKLFRPFQRLHSLHEFPGTGVGLATAQRIVHRHGGRIWAKSTVDAGATFYFTLPEHPGAP